MIDQTKVDAICELVAMGDSQRAACRSVDVDESTFRLWRRESPEVDTQYARAREDRANLWAEQIMEIADTTEAGTKTTLKGDGTTEIVTGDMIEHRKLRIDARKWMMARILPKQYGDKVQHTGDGGGPVKADITIAFVKTGP